MDVIVYEIFILLILFQVKHFLADYLFQTPYMIGKLNKKGWVLPLLAHAAVHTFSTLGILLVFAPSLWYLSIFDGVVHFTMDRIKASPNLLNRWGPDKAYFWWVLGLDQMVHHLTHYTIIYLIIRFSPL